MVHCSVYYDCKCFSVFFALPETVHLNLDYWNNLEPNFSFVYWLCISHAPMLATPMQVRAHACSYWYGYARTLNHAQRNLSLISKRLMTTEWVTKVNSYETQKYIVCINWYRGMHASEWVSLNTAWLYYECGLQYMVSAAVSIHWDVMTAIDDWI